MKTKIRVGINKKSVLSENKRSFLRGWSIQESGHSARVRYLTSVDYNTVQDCKRNVQIVHQQFLSKKGENKFYILDIRIA